MRGRNAQVVHPFHTRTNTRKRSGASGAFDYLLSVGSMLSFFVQRCLFAAAALRAVAASAIADRMNAMSQNEMLLSSDVAGLRFLTAE